MTENIKLTTKLLSEFSKSLEKRSSFFLSYESLKPLLDWRFIAWQKEMSLLGKAQQNLESWSDYYQLLVAINEIFLGIERRVLDEDSLNAHPFFTTLEKHIDEHLDSTVLVKEGDVRFYAEDLLNTFYTDFFARVNKTKGYYTIWDTYFPSAWKIRAATVLDFLPQKVALKYFLNWASDRINSGKEYDSELETTSSELFPDVDPIRWAAILTYALAPITPEGKLEYVIKKDWVFGSFGRMQGFTVISEDEVDTEQKIKEQREANYIAETNSTIELLFALSKIVPGFHYSFSHEAIKIALGEAEALHYSKESQEYRKKNRLVQILNEALKFQVDNS